MIPWKWSLYFTASELRHNYVMDFSRAEESDNDEAELVEESENIFGILHPGMCTDGKTLENDVVYSMLGTNRRISHFRLYIRKVKEEDSEKAKCRIRGFVGYTTEIDFKDETIDDEICVELSLPLQRYNEIVELIKTKTFDILEIRLSNVSGFYSDWSPSISAHHIKVLTDSKDHSVIMHDDCKINPPRLGNIGGLNLSIIKRHILNPKQDLRGVDVEKLFEETENSDEFTADEKNGNFNNLNQWIRICRFNPSFFVMK